MPAHITMSNHDTASRRYRWPGRTGPAAIGGGGFAIGFAWACAGSFVLGLGTHATDRATACAWLAVEMLIGAGMLAALLLGSPPTPTPR